MSVPFFVDNCLKKSLSLRRAETAVYEGEEAFTNSKI